MKTKIAFLTFCMLVFVVIQAQSQNEKKDKTETVLLGEPTFEQTEEGIHVKVWIIPEEETDNLIIRKKEISNENEDPSVSSEKIKSSNRKTDKSMRSQHLEPTHKILVEIDDAEKNEELENANPKLIVVYPSHTSTSVDLKNIMKNFSGNITLDETGQYEFSIIVAAGSTAKTIQFNYSKSQ